MQHQSVRADKSKPNKLLTVKVSRKKKKMQNKKSARRQLREHYRLVQSVLLQYGDWVDKDLARFLMRESDLEDLDDDEPGMTTPLDEQVYIKAKLLLTNHQWHEQRCYLATEAQSLHAIRKLRAVIVQKNAKLFGLTPATEDDGFTGHWLDAEQATILAIRMAMKNAPHLFAEGAKVLLKVSADGTTVGDKSLVCAGLQVIGTTLGVDGARAQSADTLVPVAMFWAKESEAMYSAPAFKKIAEKLTVICENGVDVDGIRFHMEANQMFFTPDLKTAQQFMEISGVGSGKIAKKCFCPFCTLKAEDCWKNTGDDANANREEHLARLKTPRFSWMGMDPKYLVYVPCGLHAKCR
jgi:hypothetical protein